ncbi:anti-sigma-I factor RsgI family protein [Clostridium cellulovorans]|uniref:Anti-sigma factor RsgI-like middle domain-containing protein n=1 Tax=Clostridium cellulovorans (strain ATCC 35296 / DSM 3052 / OCM 3 / 743B) TaxID=573061 RepID=D9SNP7_CLOC7|nr:hypothetical protein [Clostridium cellulovorans]ADL49918.1 hypothetical protein Clocel_0129 [Clostridium cellulovorans 743B]
MLVSGLVLKIRRKYVIALDSNGYVIKIKIGSLTPLIGEIYHGTFLETKPSGYYFRKYKTPVLIITFIITISLIICSYLYYTPTTTVYIEASAQVTLSINRYNKVVKAIALNSEGDKLLTSVRVKGTTLDESLNILYDGAIKNRIIDQYFAEAKQIYRVNIDSEANIDITSFLNTIKSSPYIIHINNKGNVIYNSQYK